MSSSSSSSSIVTSTKSSPSSTTSNITSTTATNTSSSTAMMTAEAKQELARCEQEIALIKTAIRNIGTTTTTTSSSSSTPTTTPFSPDFSHNNNNNNSKKDDENNNNDSTNTLTIKWIKVEGLPESAIPKLTLQLSSPIESAVLTRVHSNDTKVLTNDTKVSQEEETLSMANVITSEDSDLPGEVENDVSVGGEGGGEKEGGEVLEEAKVVTEQEIGKDIVADAVPEKGSTVEDFEVVESASPATTGSTATSLVSNDDGSVVTFRGVEIEQATLSVEAMDADIPLGSSTAYDLAPYTSQLLDVMNTKTETYSTELSIPILAPGSSSSSSSSSSESTEPICTVTVELSFRPSMKDIVEGLYERLNKANDKKVAAIEKLRQVAIAAARARANDNASQLTATGASKQGTIKAGFLTKKETSESTSLINDTVKAWYSRILGPNSFIRMFAPILKNYVLFAGFVALAHYKGHYLALPPPV